MCFIFPCVMKKPAFATSDEPIDKLNLFFLSGRTVSRFRRKRKEKSVPTDRKKKLQILSAKTLRSFTEHNYLFTF